MTSCRTCHADIIWAETTSGKAMPLDAQPSASGTFVFIAGKTRMATAEDRELHRPTHTSHFATCPFAAQHRRAK